MFKTIIAVGVLVALVLVLGCATKCICPTEERIIMSPMGMPLTIPEGFFDDDDNSFSRPEFDKWIEELQEQLRRGGTDGKTET